MDHSSVLHCLGGCFSPVSDIVTIPLSTLTHHMKLVMKELHPPLWTDQGKLGIDLSLSGLASWWECVNGSRRWWGKLLLVTRDLGINGTNLIVVLRKYPRRLICICTLDAIFLRVEWFHFLFFYFSLVVNPETLSIDFMQHYPPELQCWRLIYVY